MNDIIWNCRGIEKKGLSSFIKDMIHDYQLDFLGIQETMKKNFKDSLFRKVDIQKSFAWHWVPSRGKLGGMLCGINIDRFDVKNFESGAHVISAVVQDKKLKVDLLMVFVYGPAQGGKE